eukprot:TRINITY_DN25532_c0_g1_i1.p1 TRINITY_DN25532_c0_g1~~TRINITY_DN25532_c0_g1_i1.p1  ORF type:complete len:160 (+),score=23.82 TRINITY_DN25532_c0_g1_i1:175-654(+)
MTVNGGKNMMVNQEIMGTYKRSERLQEDRILTNATSAALLTRTLACHPSNLSACQTSKRRERVQDTILQRYDAEPRYHGEEVQNELRQVLASFKKHAPQVTLQPMTFEEGKNTLRKKGASGLWDKWGNMEDCLNDPQTKGKVTQIIERLGEGRTSPNIA